MPLRKIVEKTTQYVTCTMAAKSAKLNILAELNGSK